MFNIFALTVAIAREDEKSDRNNASVEAVSFVNLRALTVARRTNCMLLKVRIEKSTGRPITGAFFHA